MKKNLLHLFLLFGCILLNLNTNATIRYVKPSATGTGTGASWANASGDLQLMIDNSSSGDTIWVAAGTHKPTRLANATGTVNVNNRDDAYVLKSGVKIFGGFAGTETLFSQRNFISNITILSGDIGTVGTTTDNCYHVVISSGAVGAAVLDGFSVVGANGNATTTLTVNANTITRNQGGGINITASSPFISNCIISLNTTAGGGGAYLNSSSGPSFDNCTFSFNSSTNGGGMFNAGSSTANINNCTFSSNAGTNNGGGILNISSTCVIENTAFYSNTCFNGAGIASSNSITTINACIFSGNVASAFGGGIYTINSSSVLTMINTLVNGNTSAIAGGIYNSNGTVTISSSTIAGNKASTNGGGTYFSGTISSPSFIKIDNSIVFGNTNGTSADNIFVNTGATSPTVSYCDIEGGFTGTNNINIDPLFVSPQPASAAPTTSGDYTLQNCSQVINAGSNALIPSGVTTDLSSNARIVNTTVDLGAYEKPSWVVADGSGIVYVDSTKNGDGSSWTNALSNLADALKIAKSNTAISQIWVAKGTYYPTYSADSLLCAPTNSRDKAFVLVNNVKIYGGFAGGETILTQANPTTNTTILSGDIGTLGNTIDNSYHVVVSSGSLGTAVLDGFTITGGNANTASSLIINGNNMPRNGGGGISFFLSSPTISNCKITGNRVASSGTGAGIYLYASSPTINDCRIESNTAVGSGGGIYVLFLSNATIKNTIFNSNTASVAGGGLLNNSTSKFINCSFRGNSATSTGGGIQNVGSTANLTLTNCLISGNLSITGGGLSSGTSALLTINNSTISNNRVTSSGGGIYFSGTAGASGPFIYNSIIYGNKVGTTANNIIISGGLISPTVNFSDVEGGYTGTNNFDADPLFISPTSATSAPTISGNYQLQLCSPAINVGSNALIPLGITTDLNEFARISNTTVDVGAYEKQYGTPDASGIVYVDSTKNGDGSSWTNAIPELADALKAAKGNSAITQIWVANGTYYPLYDAVSLGCSPTNNRDKAFVMVNNVKVYGGFAGGETLLSQRNWNTNITTLSGDLGIANDTSDNSYHVVISAGALGTAVLDGFTITRGNSISGSGTITVNSTSIDRNFGAGMINATSSPGIANNTFLNNYAISGGGIYNITSTSSISACSFSNNVSTLSGAAIHNKSVTTSTFSNCTFSNNTSGNYSGGIYNDASSITINDCDFANNAAVNGSAIANLLSSVITTNRCKLAGGSSTNGGAIYNSSSTLTILNSLLSGNRATFDGGAIYNTTSGNLTIINSTIAGNKASTGGGIFSFNATNTFRNSIAYGNSATISITFYSSVSTFTISQSIVEGGGFTGINVLNLNPGFITPVSASLAPTISGDYHILSCSAAYNSGDSTVIPAAGKTFDLDSNTRIKFTNVDMGAYEVQTLPLTVAHTAGIVYVDSSKNGDGSSWTNALKELSDALKAANSNTSITQIWVAKGTYKPIYDAQTGNCSPTDIRDKAFVLENNVKLYGGFAGNETLLSQRDYVNNKTILSGDIGVADDSTDNCYHVVISAGNVGTAVFDGFTVTKGFADGSVGPAYLVKGQNTIRPYGGGMQIILSSPTVQNIIFYNNSASQNGGGMYLKQSSPTIKNCLFTGNNANTTGAIEIATSSNCIINYCKIVNNTCNNSGAGININTSSSPSIRNSLIAGNYTPGGGGGIYASSATPSIINSTIAGNKASFGGGYYNLGSTSIIKNSIIWGNVVTSTGNAIYLASGTTTVSYSNIEGGFSGISNVNSDPLFINLQPASTTATDAGDYHIQECSRSVNSGNNTDVVSGDTTDLDNNPRIKFSTVDMGAYELQTSLVFSITPTAGIVYVDKTKASGSNGSSWANAVPELADAIKASYTNYAITEIWVAKGTYYPLHEAGTLSCIATNNRDKSFVLINGVKIYGGFNGNETLLSQRDWVNNTTILSGDIGVANDSTDNCFHVVISAAFVGTATLDGFTITKGTASGSSGTKTVQGRSIDRSNGGGFYADNSSPTIANCNIEYNSASFGGGSIGITSSPIFTNCKFTNNTVSNSGGGMYNSTSSLPNITGCTFSGNKAPSGSGGGIMNITSSNALIKHCTFTGNSSGINGGGVYNTTSSPTITNCLIAGNSALYGAGIANITSASPTIINTTVASNNAIGSGGGIFNSSASNSVIKNCIVYGNTAGVSSNSIFASISTPVVTYSLVEGGYSGAGNINFDPEFINAQTASSAPTTAGDYRLTECSPAIDAGDSTLLPAGTIVDLDSNQRIKYKNVDMGAYEVQLSTVHAATHTGGILYVDQTKSGNGSSWSNALTELADALKAAKLNTSITQIWVAKGTYYPKYDAVSLNCVATNIRDRSFVLIDNVKIYGGFIGNETLLSQRDWLNNVTTLSGDIGLINDSTDNSFHVVIGAKITNSTLDGFTITKGNAAGATGSLIVNTVTIDRNYGGGLFGSTLTFTDSINNCKFNFNDASYGAGLYNILSAPVITNCFFTDNKASNSGGGIYNTTSSSATISGCTFSNNKAIAGSGGGLVNTVTSNSTIKKCSFTANSCAIYGGGIYNTSCSPLITNCLLSGNTAQYGAGLANVTLASPNIINTTVASNNASNQGGGIYNTSSSNALIKNCIIYGNIAITGNAIQTVISTPVVSYSLVEGGFAGTSNFNLNPNFVSPQIATAAPTVLGDYRLQSCSPAINTGDSSLLPVGTTTDLDNNTRVKFSNIDMGAYELQTVDYNNSTWRGFNNNWDSVINWCGGYIPTDSTNVTIPSGLSNYPTLSNNSFSKNITLANATSLTINSTGKLTIKGTYTNSGSVITNNGTIVLAGITGAQNFPNTTSTIAAMNNLEVNNSSGVNLDKSFTLTGTLTPTIGTINLNNDTITLSSTATGTARVATVQSGASFTYTGTGKFQVQRYHPARRAWRLMTSPLYGTGTIFETWQNNGVYTVGKGTLVTGPGPTGSAGNGLDTSQLNNPSLKSGVPITNILNTKVPLSNNTGLGADNKGYFIFIRGDRNPINTNIINSNITTLSSVGKLQIGAQNFAASTTANGFTLIGNPYACPVNFSLLNRINLANRFYIWDPKLNSVGGYVVIEKLTGLLPYTPTPASPGGQDSIIQSSQAIYVQTIAATTASLGFVESNKVATQNAGIFRPTGNFTMPPSVQSSLYVVNPDTAILADGNIVVFDDAYNNSVDIDDAIKFTNINETFGLVRNGQTLAIERKQLNPANDTVFFKLTKTTQQNYRFEFEFSNININNLTPFFEDDYLHTSTLLNNDGISTIDFNINGDAASANPLRFRIVFKQATTLPLTFTSIKAWKQNLNNMVEWKVENQLNIREYIIEKSTDGRHFSPIGTQAPTGNTGGSVIYNFPDVHPVSGNNYYRVRSIGSNGTSSYSKIVNVFIGDKKPVVIVSPNPIVNNTIVLQLNDMPVGKYMYRLFNPAGQLITTSTFDHAVVSETKTLTLPVKPAAGSYQLEIIHLGNKEKLRVGVMIE